MVDFPVLKGALRPPSLSLRFHGAAGQGTRRAAKETVIDKGAVAGPSAFPIFAPPVSCKALPRAARLG
jgi:hypothetical protein